MSAFSNILAIREIMAAKDKANTSANTDTSAFAAKLLSTDNLLHNASADGAEAAVNDIIENEIKSTHKTPNKSSSEAVAALGVGTVNQNSMITQPITTFTLFPDLPKEIRNKVWDLLMLEARVIEIEWTATAGGRKWLLSPESMHRSPVLYRINHEARGELLRVHKILELNSNTAEAIAIRSGAKVENQGVGVSGKVENDVGEKKDKTDLPANSEKREDAPFVPITFFNPDIDTIYFGGSMKLHYTISDMSMKCMSPELLKQMKHVAVRGEEFWEDNSCPSPYDPYHPVLFYIGQKLGDLMDETTSIESLSIVRGDYFTENMGKVFLPKPNGIVELEHSSLGNVEEYGKNSVKSWFQALLVACRLPKYPTLLHSRAYRAGHLVDYPQEAEDKIHLVILPLQCSNMKCSDRRVVGARRIIFLDRLFPTTEFQVRRSGFLIVKVVSRLEKASGGEL